MKFAPRTVERSMTMQAHILLALKTGPLSKAELTTRLGIEQSDAGRQVVKYQLHALLRQQRIRRIGSRASSLWALIGHRGTVPTQRPVSRTVRRPTPTPVSTSWWVVSDEEFSAALRKRATITAWDIALMGTPDRE